MLYLFISIIASTLGALSGIGGGVLIKPVLDMFSPLGVSSIGFLSGVTVLSMTSVSLIKNRKSDFKVDKKRSSYLAGGAVLGGIGGKQIFELLLLIWEKGNILVAIQSALLMLLTLGVVIYLFKKQSISSLHIKNVFACVVTGLLLGAISAFLGIGGGPFHLALLYYFYSMDTKTAALNSIYIIFCSQLASLILTIATGNIPSFAPTILALMILGGISGGLIGSYLLKKLHEKQVERIFHVIMGLIVLICLFNFIRACIS